MFRRISHRLALQFTGFVFLLFLVNGAIFLAADYKNAERQMQLRLVRDAQIFVQRMPDDPRTINTNGPGPPGPRMIDRVRVLSEAGETVFSSPLFSELSFNRREGFSTMHIQNEEFIVLTTHIIRADRQPAGFLQIAEPQRLPVGDLPLRALLYLIVSIIISGFTYLLGILFARRSLRPAEEMFRRLEQFTQDASHELRTPLAVLGSSLDVALKTGTYKEGIASAKEDLKQIGGLVERLLELARLGDFALDLSPTDLSGLCAHTADRFRPLAAEKSVTIETNIETGITVKADDALLQQVLTNLLSNAIKFNVSGGVVRLKLTKNKLVVSDTGIGISAKDLPHIFDRFYQADTSRSKEGFGLGLALVKRIVDMHYWRINADSSTKGTTFTINIKKS